MKTIIDVLRCAILCLVGMIVGAFITTVLCAIASLIIADADAREPSCAQKMIVGYDAAKFAVDYQRTHDLIDSDKLSEFFNAYREFAEKNSLYSFEMEWSAHGPLSYQAYMQEMHYFKAKGRLIALEYIIYNYCGV